jgi:tetratricopeptide (TPR) repeat protein
MKSRAFSLAGLSLFAVAFAANAAAPVRLWETNLVIPTYLAAPPSPVPRFYEGRTYQGAKATFHPYPVQDVLTDIKTNKSYKALFLENQYIQISVLPELGGRIFSAVDKANGYDFFYRQHVIKPALIGMLGAWISGGVEWNVPHHHRATSFMPVDYTTTTNADGSATIWVGEIELRHRMKWLVGMTLYPDRSCLELTCKMFNRTPFAHPMLFWINTAVHANTNYQVIFPPSTEWAAQHSKPEFASWPIARQTYGGTDYTRGVDISWWKNHPNPVSFFAWNYEDDWFGGYDHGQQAGVVHVADHHVAPGKKFFEWGNGPEGETWSKILTDEDGPYLELMAGAWSDNQPDYSWIQPGETREWKHWWYPVRNLGGAKMANRDAAVNLEVTNRTAIIAVNTTKEFKGARVRLTVLPPASMAGPLINTPLQRGERAGAEGENRFNGLSTTRETAEAVGGVSAAGSTPLKRGVNERVSSARKALFDQTVDIGPAKPFSTTVMMENEVAPEQLRLSLSDADGRELVAYQPTKPKGTPMPKPVEKPKSPKDYTTTDELYFTGQRIEQLYSPSFEAAPYYEEMLRRDPGDYRANTALGILLCKQWRWEEAAKHLSNAIARATANFIRPKDGEAFYYLGVALKSQGKAQEADRAFRKAVWSEAFKAAGYCRLAELDAAAGNYTRALEMADQALSASALNGQARNLKSALLRALRRYAEAESLAHQSINLDPLDAGARFELYRAQSYNDPGDRASSAFASFRTLMRDNVQSYFELSADYAQAGLWEDAVAAVEAYSAYVKRGSHIDLMACYYIVECQLAPVADKPGAFDAAAKAIETIQTTTSSSYLTEFSFPSRFEEEPMLRMAIKARSSDARAAYLLGCLLYDNQPENAIKAWEESRQRDDKFALTHRNLALAYAQHEKNIPKAIASLEKVVELDPREPRFFYELDLQYEAVGAPVAQRLEMLTQHHDTVARRDDALTREIVLLTVAGQADRALALLRGRHFRNWEGSSQIHNVYVDACLAHGQYLAAEKPREALREYEAALEYPENLEVGRARRAPRTAQIQYLIGTAHEALGDAAAAKAAFEKAAAGRDRGASESSYFHALALQKLGRADEAKPIFERLVKAGEEQLAQGETADYFAKFGEKQSERVCKANAHYLIGLGQLGLGAKAKQALALHPAHLGANAYWVR